MEINIDFDLKRYYEILGSEIYWRSLYEVLHNGDENNGL